MHVTVLCVSVYISTTLLGIWVRRGFYLLTYFLSAFSHTVLICDDFKVLYAVCLLVLFCSTTELLWHRHTDY